MLINWSLTNRGRPRRSKHLPTHLRLTIPLTGPLMTNQRHERLDCLLMGRIYECTSLLSLQGCKPLQWKRWSTAIVAPPLKGNPRWWWWLLKRKQDTLESSIQLPWHCEFKSSFLWEMSKIQQAKYKRCFEVINIQFSSSFFTHLYLFVKHLSAYRHQKNVRIKNFSVAKYQELGRTESNNYWELSRPRVEVRVG